MERSKQTTDIDRKLAIYYHPLFQEVIKNILLLFKLPANQSFEIGLIQFVEFNLKLQKSLLPAFELQNALISGLNDWVKEVAECLSYEGMVSTNRCEQITNQNFSKLIQKQLESIYIQPLAEREEYLRILMKTSSHDAFKLLGVKINKEVFNKFMFDLCSTWCEFLDIELFSYFLIAIYVQLSEGPTFAASQFRKTSTIRTIDLEFMQQFEEIKAIYSKNRKKDLRYYRAWCEWNYLRINEIGEALILQLDQIHQNDPRVLQLALIFQRSIQVINQQITNQSTQPEPSKPAAQLKQVQKEVEFLVAKKIELPADRQRRTQLASQAKEPSKEMYVMSVQQQNNHRFQIEIDAEGNMYLRKIVRLPILGSRIEPEPAERREIVKLRYLQRKKEQIRQISNLYRRMQNMKVRLEHNPKNDPYSYKEPGKVAERDEFYHKQTTQKNKNIYTNVTIDKIIHRKIQPQPTPPPNNTHTDFKPNFRPEFIEENEPIRKNEDYIHKVMAPSFVTDQKNNISFGRGQGSVYGVGPYAEKRDLKIGLPKLKHMDKKIEEIGSYHLIGKLTKNRGVINQRLKSFSTNEQFVDRLSKQKEEYKHLWTRYINEQEMAELNNYQDFYTKLEQAKKQFAKDYQSAYRENLKQILLYQNKRYEMGGVIDRKQQQQFYERIRKLIRRDTKREQRRKRKTRLRQYRKAVGNKQKRKMFQNIFISHHRSVIRSIKEERKNVSFAK